MLMTRRAGKILAKVCIPLLVVLGGCQVRDDPRQQGAPGLYTCTYSDELYQADQLLMRQEAPTFFRLMPSRYLQIVQAQRGYHCLGTATVAFNGHGYNQAGMTDDAGIVELIPTVSTWTGLTLARAFDLTAFLVIFLGGAIGYAGYWTSYPLPRLRWMGLAVFLCIALLEARVANVYVFQSFPLVAGIPWVVHYARTRLTIGLNVSIAALAFCCSWCSLVRIGTSVICLAFLFPLVLTRVRVSKVLASWLLIILACVPAVTFERSLIARRDNLLISRGERATAENTHTIWHSIYIGLAFIPNTDVPEYNDRVGAEKVRSIDPRVPYTSLAYDAILRREVLNLAMRRPGLLIANLAAKTGIVFLLAAILLFPSRQFLFADRPAWWIDSAFAIAIAVSAMNAILVVPRIPYLLTFLCLTCLYSSVKFATAHQSLCRDNVLPSGDDTAVSGQKSDVRPT